MRPASDSASPPAKSRNLWPWTIIAAFAVFIVWIGGFIVFTTFNRVDLVQPDYYAEELRFQDQIDRQARAQSLPAPAQVRYEAALDQIVVTLPPEHAGKQITGQIHLYRPSAAGLDRRVPLEFNVAGEQALAADQLSAGLWRVRLTWRVDGREFYHDQDVVVPSRSAFNPVKG